MSNITGFNTTLLGCDQSNVQPLATPSDETYRPFNMGHNLVSQNYQEAQNLIISFCSYSMKTWKLDEEF